MKILQKPKKQSLKEYYESKIWKVNSRLSIRRRNVTCIQCYGEGKYKDPKDYDIVDGYKFAGYITCELCAGKGTITKQELIEIYKKDYLIRYEKDLKWYKKNIAIFNSIKSKITKAELRWMISGKC